MKDSVYIGRFDGGLVSNMAQEDVPENAYVDGVNVDPYSVAGSLSPIPLDEVLLSGNFSACSMEWIGDGSVLLFNDGNVLKKFGGTSVTTVGNLTKETTTCPSIEVVNGNAYIGNGYNKSTALPRGQWYGHIENRDQFGTPITDGWYLEDAEIKSPSSFTITFDSWVSNPEGIPQSTVCGYAASFIYDGFQESPLHKFPNGNATSGLEVDFVWKLSTPSSLANKRITGINVYRAIFKTIGSVPTNFVEEPQLTNYQLLSSISMDDADWVASGSGWEIEFTDNNILGAAYQNISDQAEELKSNALEYTLSTYINNRLVVADVHSYELGEDWSCYVWFSRPLQPSVFDITKDFVVLKHKPVAIESSRGKVFAFTAYDTYIINMSSENPFIEEIINGIGCVGRNAVLSSEGGIYHADRNAIYLNAQRISDNVQRKWQTINKDKVWIVYDQKRDAAVVINGLGECLVYSNGRWDYWALELDVRAVQRDKHGEPIAITGDGITKLFSAEIGQRSMNWTGKKFEHDSHKSFVYRINGALVDAFATIIVGLNTDLGSYQEGDEVPYGERRVQWFQPTVSISTHPLQSTRVDSLSIITRNHRQPRP